MRLPDGLGTLTYCLNIHPTQTLAEVTAAIEGPVRSVKRAVCPDAPFAVGLRIPAQALAEIEEGDGQEAFGALLAEEGLLPVTMNGFPYGPFHGTRVKEDVYLPDWRSEARLDYTLRLAELMAGINPEGAVLSLSTVPGAFKPNAAGAEGLIAETYLRAVAGLMDLEARTGRTVALALEPEPFCMLETIEETVAFFRDHLLGGAAQARLAELSGMRVGPDTLRRHLGLCYDVCHAAVEFEDPRESLAALRAEGIPVHKLQLSSAIRIEEGSDAARHALQPFDEPTYLHQLISRSADGTLARFADLPQALGPGGAPDGAEWRVHFHVPVFAREAGAFGTTQAYLREILALHRRAPISPHLEIETYTWDVMPPALRSASVHGDIARELGWVISELTA